MATTEQPEKVTEKVSLPTLTAMVVGSMVGAGVFLLPHRFGVVTGVLGAIIAWTIAGTGMLIVRLVRTRGRAVLHGATRTQSARVPAAEAALFAVIVLGAVAGVVSLATGAIEI